MRFFNQQEPAFYKEEPFLSAEMVVSWKRRKNNYNFKELPPNAIVILDRKIASSLSGPFSKKLKGLPGYARLINENTVVCSPMGSGAPGILLLMEELRVLGVRRYLTLGTAGVISDVAIEGTVFLVSKSYSTTGSAMLYAAEDSIPVPKSDWLSALQSEFQLAEASCWSTDCPYRETKSLIRHFKDKGASLVDMETAAVYAFSHFYNLASVSVLIAADSLLKDAWQPPENMERLAQSQKEMVRQLLKSKIFEE